MENVNIETFDEMIGKTITETDGATFKASDGTVFEFYHSQDCCESVDIDDIVGELSDLLDSPILTAEKISTEGAREVECADSITWTFYRFATAKGTVTIKWLGSSNGYYSESVDFRVIKP